MKFISRRNFLFGFASVSVVSIGFMTLFQGRPKKINANLPHYVKLILLDNNAIPNHIEKRHFFFKQIIVDGYFLNKDDFIQFNGREM